MKLPKTFILSKDLETKTKQLLKKPKGPYLVEEKNIILNQARKNFPRLIDYLLELYPNLRVTEKENKGKEIEHRWKVWFFYDNEQYLGSINTYNKNTAELLFEQGYSGLILIKKEHRRLEYRTGYYYDDNTGAPVITKKPLRRDSSKDIPFP
ncbi:hypothetical protein FJZ53_01675 [Candidatus Woesearchaeota archaeon]|nr:hypothetical protein [Candidatus Woesearchaeota archaeon]